MKLFTLEKYQTQDIIEPDVIKVVSDDLTDLRQLSKAGSRRLYKQIGISPNLSKQIYDISSDIWEAIINMKCEEPNDKRDIPGRFDLNNFKLISINGTNRVVDISCLESTESRIDEFHKFLDDNNARVSLSDEDYCKIYVGPDEIGNDDNDGKPVVMIDMDFRNSRYEMYTGIVNNGRFILTEKPVLTSDSLSSFLEYTLQREVVAAAKVAPSMHNMYPNEDDTKLSARETIDILSKAGMTFSIDEEDGSLTGITGLGYGGEDEIMTSLNSYGIPFKSLKKLSFLRKSLKHDSISIDDILNIFSTNYFGMNQIMAKNLSEILSMSLKNVADRSVIKSELGTNHSNKIEE